MCSIPATEASAVEIELSEVLSALANWQRLRIVAQLDEHPGIPCWQFWGEMNKSTRSHHLKILRKAGIIESWREASEVLNRLQREELDARFPGVLDSVLAART